MPEFGYCAPDAWMEQAGLLLGVVLSATDPVAVVALLKDLGLTGLLPVGIEGESLFNDGTALVVFNLFLSTLQKASAYGTPAYENAAHWSTPTEVVAQFLYAVAVGLGFGIGMGFLLTLWLSTVYNDAVVEVTLTLTFAYLTFFTAEVLGSSGVLAVVALGLYMARNGRTRISPQVEHFLTEFWEMLAYFGNTLIFVITGIIVVEGVWRAESPVTGVDFMHLLLLYVGCLLIRGVLVCITYALFNVSGTLVLEWKWALVSTWGGLRGAVGLALGLIVFTDLDICPHIRTRVMFHTAGMVVLTVVINGTSMRYLISALQMNRVPRSKALVFTQALRTIEEAGEKRERDAMREGVFSSVVWEEARHFYLKESDLKAEQKGVEQDEGKGKAAAAKATLSDASSPDVHRPPPQRMEPSTPDAATAVGGPAVAATPAASSAAPADPETPSSRDTSPPSRRAGGLFRLNKSGKDISKRPNRSAKEKLSEDEALTRELRRRILLMTKRCYWNLLEVGTISRDAAKYLRQLSDGALIEEESELHEWHALNTALASDSILAGGLQVTEGGSVLIRGLEFLADALPFAFGGLRYVAGRMAVRAVELQHNVLLGFLLAREEAIEAIPKLMMELDFESGEGPMKEITISLHLDVVNAHACLEALQQRHIEAYSSIATVIAARAVLHKQQQTLEKLSHEGMLDMHEVKKLSDRVERQMKRLVFRPPFLPLPNAIDVLRQVPWLSVAPEPVLQGLLTQSYEITVKKGQLLLRQGDALDVVFVVMRGLLVLERKGVGSVGGGVGGSVAPGGQAAEGGGGRVSFSADVANERPGKAKALETIEEDHDALLDNVPPTPTGHPASDGAAPEGESEHVDQLSVLHIGFSVNETTWGTGAPSQYGVRAMQDAVVLGIPGSVLRGVALSNIGVDNALWLAVGAQVARETIRSHALAAGAYLAPWQLGRVMSTMRLHHIAHNHAQTHTFNEAAMVILIAGSARLLRKPLLLQLVDEAEDDAESIDPLGRGSSCSSTSSFVLATENSFNLAQQVLGIGKSSGSPFGSGRKDDGKETGGGGGGGALGPSPPASPPACPPEAYRYNAKHAAQAALAAGAGRLRGWALVRWAMADREGASFEAPAMIQVSEETGAGGVGNLFRVTFDADARFACEETAIYQNPKTLALSRLLKLSDHLVHTNKHTKAQADDEDAVPTADGDELLSSQLSALDETCAAADPQSSTRMTAARKSGADDPPPMLNRCSLKRIYSRFSLTPNAVPN